MSEHKSSAGKFQSWLWPDHAIGKRESRKLREEHNAVVNSHWELTYALSELLTWASIPDGASMDAILVRNQARVALERAGGDK